MIYMSSNVIYIWIVKVREKLAIYLYIGIKITNKNKKFLKIAYL